MHNFVLHRAAVRRMRMTNDGTADWLALALRIEQSLQGACRGIDKYRFAIWYFAHWESRLRFWSKYTWLCGYPDPKAAGLSEGFCCKIMAL
jgi:hypothetical protein